MLETGLLRLSGRVATGISETAAVGAVLLIAAGRARRRFRVETGRLRGRSRIPDKTAIVHYDPSFRSSESRAASFMPAHPAGRQSTNWRNSPST